MLRTIRPLLAASSALLVLALGFAPAEAAKGQFSIGGNFGTGIYSNSDINDILEVGGYEEVTSGWEYGGSLRYQVAEKLALDLEGNMIKGKSTTEDPPDEDVEISTSAVAIPLNLVYTLSANDSYVFNIFGGPGILASPKFKAEQGAAEDEVEGSSSFYGQAGLEAQWFVSPTFALSARALGRMAKSELEDSDTDMDLGGVAFGLGARLFFGGSE
jgi:hypothetical protein